jgi:hypothetical protein
VRDEVPDGLRVRSPLGGLRRGHAELGQEAAVVGLHPLLSQPPVVVVPERVDHFPLDVLAGGLDGADGRVGEGAGEVAGERIACRQELAVSDDLLTDDSQVAEGGAQRGEVSAELFEAQVAAGPVEDVILREVGAERGVVLTGDRLVADADQAASKRTVRDEARHGSSLLLY